MRTLKIVLLAILLVWVVCAFAGQYELTQLIFADLDGNGVKERIEAWQVKASKSEICPVGEAFVKILEKGQVKCKISEGFYFNLATVGTIELTGDKTLELIVLLGEWAGGSISTDFRIYQWENNQLAKIYSVCLTDAGFYGKDGIEGFAFVKEKGENRPRLLIWQSKGGATCRWCPQNYQVSEYVFNSEKYCLVKTNFVYKSETGIGIRGKAIAGRTEVVPHKGKEFSKEIGRSEFR